MSRTPVLLIFAMLAAVSVLLPSVALAHAFPVAEQPRVGSTVKTPPSEVAIKYDSPIQLLFAKLQVLSRAGIEEAAGKPTLSADRRTLSVKLKPLVPGTYKVKWSVIALDGHRTEGSYDFTVAESGP
jgi:methionine-rich copper-binding protein CopC